MSTTLTVSNSVLIAAPRELVFDFVADPRNDPKWCQGVSDVAETGSFAGTTSTAEGRHYLVTHRPLFTPRTLVTWVRETRPPSRVVLDERDGGLTMLVAYELEIADGMTTRLTQTDVITLPLPRLPARVAVAAMSRAKRRQLMALQRVLGQPPSPTAAG